MKSRIQTSIVLLSGILLTAAAILYWMALDLDNAFYQDSVETIRSIQRLDANWSMEAIKVKSEPQADFDSLASFIPRMRTLKDKLTGITLNSDQIPDRLANNINAFISNIGAKEEEIERFKSNYAILRNSERYLPLAAASVVQTAQSTNYSEIIPTINNVVEGLAAFLNAPTDAGKARIATSFDSLRERSLNFTEQLADDLANFISHGQVILNTKLTTETLLNNATAYGISDDADSLTSSLETLSGRRKNTKEQYEYGVLGSFGAAAIFALISLFFGFGKSGGERQTALRYGANANTNARSGGVPSHQLPMLPADNIIAKKVFAGVVAEDLSRILENAKPDADLLTSHSDDAINHIASMQSLVSQLSGDTTQDQELLSQLKVELANASEIFDQSAFSTLAKGIEEQYDSMLKISSKLNQFSGGEGTDDHDWINLNDMLRDIVRPIRNSQTINTQVKLGDIPDILGSEEEFRHMLSGILNNAVLAASNENNQEKQIRIQTDLTDSNIAITITDNGPGIDEGNKKHLMSVYHSANTNSGLDLASCNYVAKKFGGKLLLNSVVGKGTAIRILFPVLQEDLS